ATKVAGRVKEIGLFACQLETFDGMYCFAPNGQIWNNALLNHTRSRGRLVSVAVVVAEGVDAGHAREALLAMLREDKRIQREPPPDVFIDGYGPNGVVLNCRATASPGELGAVQRTLVERAKQIVDGLGKDKPGASQITRVVPPDS